MMRCGLKGSIYRFVMANNNLVYNIQAPSFDEENSQESENFSDRKDDSSDDEGGLSRSLTAQRFNRSMRTVVKISKSYRSQVALRGVIKAKNRFLKSINKAPQKIEDSEKGVIEIETPICLSEVDIEWQRLSQRPPIFKMSNDIDFSDLAVYIIKTNLPNSQITKVLTENSEPGPSPPPPPPPPSTAIHGPPPPPPTAPSMSPGGAQQRGPKMKPIHVNQVHVKPNQDTVWSTLPAIEADLSDLRKLFEDTSSSKSAASDSREVMRSESVSGPLSVTESTDILIMFRQFPK